MISLLTEPDAATYLAASATNKGGGIMSLRFSEKQRPQLSGEHVQTQLPLELHACNHANQEQRYPDDHDDGDAGCRVGLP